MSSNDEHSNESVRAPRPERFTINRSIIGWHLIPEDPEHHPLLVRLFELETTELSSPETLPLELLRKPMPWELLEEGLRLIRAVAKRIGIGVRVCGNLKERPVVQLWEHAPPQELSMTRIFEGLTADAASWRVTAFYSEHEHALRQALASGEPFDTGWYGVKKEIQSARVHRRSRHGSVYIEVSAAMDEWRSLVDTAVWEATDREASSGHEVMRKLGFSDEEAETWFAELANEQSRQGILGPDNSVERSAKLGHNIGFERMCERLEALVDECEQELEATYATLVAQCRELIEQIR